MNKTLIEKTIALTSVVALSLAFAGSASAAWIGGPGMDTWTSGSVSVTAFNAQGAFPVKDIINGSGMTDADPDEHNNTTSDMWLSSPHVMTTEADNATRLVTFEFDGAYQLGVMHIWNYNNDWRGGIRYTKVEYSTDGSSWTQLVGPGSGGVFELAGAPADGTNTGFNGYTGSAGPDFGGVSAQYVRLNPNSVTASQRGNWGSSSKYGLSEVRFNLIPEPATIAVLCLGGGLVLLRKKRAA